VLTFVTILTSGTVRGRSPRFHAPEVSTIGCKDVAAVRPGVEEIADPVHCHTIRCSLLGLRPRYSVEADATVGEGAVIFHIVDHADGSIWIGVAEVRLFLIGREHNVVG
jgi:hypothetical protein